MNNRRWYPVSRLAPEQIKVLKHSMDPSMTVLLPGVETATAYGCKLVSYHRGGEDQSRVDLDLPVALSRFPLVQQPPPRNHKQRGGIQRLRMRP